MLIHRCFSIFIRNHILVLVRTLVPIWCQISRVKVLSPFIIIFMNYLNSFSQLVLLLAVTVCKPSVKADSNYNFDKLIQPQIAGSPLEMALKIYPKQSQVNNMRYDYSIHKYHMVDTGYQPNPDTLKKIDQDLVYRADPPSEVFTENKLVVENYRLLESKELRITLANPSPTFRFCVSEINVDTTYLIQIEKKGLPICINSTTKYPFFFRLYVTQPKPLVLKLTVYFTVGIMDGDQLIDVKIWPKQVIIKAIHNHLRIAPLYMRKSQKKNEIIVIRNPEPHEVQIMMIYKKKIYSINDEVVTLPIDIPSGNDVKFYLEGYDDTITIYSKATKKPHITYPILYVPTIGLSGLSIDYFNIGVLSDDRSIYGYPLMVTNHESNALYLKEIYVKSISQTVDIQLNYEGVRIPSNKAQLRIGKIYIHPCNTYIQKQGFEVFIRYYSNEEDYHSGRNTKDAYARFPYIELRSPISVGNKRFVDVSKYSQGDSDPVIENRFPIRNNLNIPLMLHKISFDETKFRVSYLREQRDFIYPNQQRQEFLFQYIGTRSLSLSPVKYLIHLQFNGFISIPIQIVVYDHSLQCSYGKVIRKCSNLPVIDFGYFHNLNSNAPKSKSIVIKNLNPENQNVIFTMPNNSVKDFNVNVTMTTLGPFPTYDNSPKKRQDEGLEYYLKSKHFIILRFSIALLPDATSGEVSFTLQNNKETVHNVLKFKVEDATIALIPQVVRLTNAYTRTIQHLNLVSTFSETYRIISATTNLSSMAIYCNNYSQIYMNQWIGMAIIYDPYAPINNLTYFCCGEFFLYHSFVQDRISGKSNDQTYVTVKLETSNLLEVTSTVIIERNPDNMVNGADKLGYKRFLNMHMLRSPKKVESEITVSNRFPNTMKYSVHFIPKEFVDSTSGYMNTVYNQSNKVSAFFCVRNEIRTRHGFTPVMLKNLFHLHFQPQEVTIQPLENGEFYLHSQSKEKEQLLNDKDLSQYIINTVNSGARMCYNMTVPKFLKDLIETDIVNQLAEKYRTEFLYQFINKEFHQYDTHQLAYKFNEFYNNMNIDLSLYCKRVKFPTFAFCKHIPIEFIKDDRILYEDFSQKKFNKNLHLQPIYVFSIKDEAYRLLKPETSDIIRFQLKNNTWTNNLSFYTVIVNNYTKAEVYDTVVKVEPAKLQISSVFLEDSHMLPKRQFQNQYFNSLMHRISSKAEWDSDKQLLQRSRVLPIYLTKDDLETNNKTISAVKTFQLTNQGDVELQISHVGFEDKEFACSHSHYKLVNLGCEHLYRNPSSEVQNDAGGKGFTIKPQQNVNLTVDISLPLSAFAENQNLYHDKVKLYLYYNQNHYFRIVLLVKLGDKNRNGFKESSNGGFEDLQNSYFTNYCLNFISFAFICLTSLIFRQEEKRNKLNHSKTNPQLLREVEGQKIEFTRYNLRQRRSYEREGFSRIEELRTRRRDKYAQSISADIVPTSLYEGLGTLLPPKEERLVRPVATISAELIDSIKQFEKKKIKASFNQSEESDNGRKNATDEDSHNISVQASISGEGSLQNSMNKESASESDYDFNENSNQQIYQRESSSDSNLPDGVEVDLNDQKLSGTDFGFGSIGKDTKVPEQKEDDNESQYNVFFSRNPLKKDEPKKNPFSWMNKSLDKKKKDKDYLYNWEMET